MTTLLGSVAAYTVIFVLLVAAAGHVVSPATLSRAVAAHGVFRWPVAVATAVTLVEAGLAVAGALAVSGQSTGWLRPPVLLASALLFAGYGGYSQQVRLTRPDTPCGCSRDDLPVTGWVVIRAYLLTGVASLGAVLSGPVLTLDRPGAPLAVALLAAGTFSAVLWHLPAAMYIPTPAARRPHQARTREGAV